VWRGLEVYTVVCLWDTCWQIWWSTVAIFCNVTLFVMQVGRVYVHINQKIWPVACSFRRATSKFFMCTYLWAVYGLYRLIHTGVYLHTIACLVYIFFPLSRLYIFNVVLMSGGGLWVHKVYVEYCKCAHSAMEQSSEHSIYVTCVIIFVIHYIYNSLYS